MPLSPGASIGAYRAHDARLNRDVALKILPDTLAADPGFHAILRDMDVPTR